MLEVLEREPGEPAHLERERHLVSAPQAADEDRDDDGHVARDPLVEAAAREVEAAAALRVDDRQRRLEKDGHETKRERNDEAGPVRHADRAQRERELLDRGRGEKEQPGGEERLQLERHAETEAPRLAARADA